MKYHGLTHILTKDVLESKESGSKEASNIELKNLTTWEKIKLVLKN